MRFGCAVSLSIFYQCQTWVNEPYQNYKLKLITKQGRWPDIELQLLSTIPILPDSNHRKKICLFYDCLLWNWYTFKNGTSVEE